MLFGAGVSELRGKIDLYQSLERSARYARAVHPLGWDTAVLSRSTGSG